MRLGMVGFVCLVLGQGAGCGSRTGLIEASAGPSATSAGETPEASAPDVTPDSGSCESGIFTLAASLPIPYALAVDGTSVYWTGMGPNFVSKVGVCGGAITVLSTDVADEGSSSIALDATNVYWTNSNGIRRTGRGGGPVEYLVAAASPTSLATDGTFFYWMDFSQYNMGSLVKMPIGGGAGGVQTVLAAGLNEQSALAVDRTSVYWTEYRPGSVEKTSLDGGPITTLATGSAGPNQIAVRGKYIYWTDTSAGGVYRLGINGDGKPYQLDPDFSAYGIAVDDSYVYWTSQGNGCTAAEKCPGSVKKIPIGGGKAITLAPNEYAPAAIVVDSTSVYWTNSLGPGGDTDGSVRKLTPK